MKNYTTPRQMRDGHWTHGSVSVERDTHEPGVGAGAILWPLAVLLFAAICGVLVVLARSA